MLLTNHTVQTGLTPTLAVRAERLWTNRRKPCLL